MIRLALLLLAAVVIGSRLNPFAGPWEALAVIACVMTAFIALVCLLAGPRPSG